MEECFATYWLLLQCKEALKDVKDCKVIPGESTAKQHQLMVSPTKIGMTRRREEVRLKKTRWWKLEDPELREKFVQRVKQELEEEHAERWEEVSRTVRNTAKSVLGETLAKAKERMETWWWSDEVQEAVLEKKEIKKLRDSGRRRTSSNSRKQTIQPKEQWRGPRRQHTRICTKVWKRKRA